MITQNLLNTFFNFLYNAQFFKDSSNKRIGSDSMVLVYLDLPITNLKVLEILLKKTLLKYHIMSCVIFKYENNFLVYVSLNKKMGRHVISYFKIQGITPVSIFTPNHNHTLNFLLESISLELKKRELLNSVFLKSSLKCSKDIQENFVFDKYFPLISKKKKIDNKISSTKIDTPNVNPSGFFDSLNFQNFLNSRGIIFNSSSTSEFSYAKFRLEQMCNTYSQIDEILKNKTLTNFEKQKLVETPDIALSAKLKKLNNSVSFEAFPVITLFDEVFLRKMSKIDDLHDVILKNSILGYISSEKTNFFLSDIFNLKETLEEFEKNPYSDERTNTIILDKTSKSINARIILLFTLVKLLEISLGYNLVFLLARRFLKHLSNIEKNETLEDTKNIIKKMGMYSCIHTTFITNFADDFINSIKIALSELQQNSPQVIKIVKGLNKKREELLLNVTKDSEEELRSFLSETIIAQPQPDDIDYEPGVDIIFNGKELLDALIYNKGEEGKEFLFKLGSLFIYTFELLNMINISNQSNLKKGNFQQIRVLSFNTNTLDLILPFSKLDSFMQLPLIIKPRNWKAVQKVRYINEKGSYEKEILSKFSEAKSTDLNEACFYTDVAYGGYLSNTQNWLKGVKMTLNIEYPNISNSTIKFMNRVQETPFEINKEFLDLTQNNLASFLLNFLSWEPEMTKNMFIFTNKNGDVKENFESGDFLHVVDESTYIKRACVFQGIELDAQEYNIFNIEYVSNINEIFNFFNFFSTAFLYKDFVIYFPFKLDSRGRGYAVGSFHYQGCNFVKTFLMIKQKNISVTKISNEDSLSSLPYWESQRKVWLEDFLKDKSRGFSHLNCENSSCKNRLLVSFDVSGSGFQIFGGLLGDTKLLEDTNFFVAKKETSVKRDVYMEVLNVFLSKYEQIQKRIEEIVEIKILEKIEKNPDILKNITEVNEKKFRAELYKIIFQIVKKEMTRKMFKDYMMPFLYSEGDRSRTKKLFKTIKENPSFQQLFKDIDLELLRAIENYQKLLKDQRFQKPAKAREEYKQHFKLQETRERLEAQERYNNLLTLEENIDLLKAKTAYEEALKNKKTFVEFVTDILYLCCYELSKEIAQTIGFVYPNLLELKSYFEGSFLKDSSVSEKKSILLMLNPVYSSFLKCYVKKIVKVCPTYSLIKGRKQSSIQQLPTLITEYNYDFHRAQCAVTPNLIHCIDKQLLEYTVLELKDRNIYIAPSHDCFSASVEYEKDIKECYAKAFIKIILEDNLLKNFFEANNINKELTYTQQKLIKEYEKNRRLLKDKEISPFILSP